MALTLGDNFSYQGAKPLDARLKYDTLANMKAVADATMYEGCLAYCVATDKTYQWKSTNTVDADTGKWREFSSGGGGASALSELTDTAISSQTDGQVLKYNGTTEKWENGTVEAGGVVQGYAFTPYGTGIDAILSALNTQLASYNVEVQKSWEGFDSFSRPKAFVCMYNSKNSRICMLLANDDIAISHLANGYEYYYRVKLTDTTSATGASTNYNYGVYISDGVANVTSLYDYALTNTYSRLQPSSNWGYSAKEVYIAGSVDMTDFSTIHGNYTTLDVTPSYSALTFYVDSAHTQKITPSTDEMFVDIPTGDMYYWNGTEYVKLGGASALSDLTDTSISNPSAGQQLTYDGTESKWKNTNAPAIPTKVSDLQNDSGFISSASVSTLTDTTITTPTNNDVLKYDSASNKWVNGQSPSGASSMAELTDTTVTNPANGQILKYNSTTQKWENTSNSSVNDVEITLADYNDLSSAEKNNGLNYFITDGQNAGYIFSVQKAVLASGSTTVSFNVPTTGEPLLTLYTSDPNVTYLSCDTSTAGVATYTFGAQSNAINVYLKIEVF